MALIAEDLIVAPGGNPRLKIDKLSVATGKLTFVVGPNGAGKTTLLKAVAGLINYQGAITWDGTVLAELSPKARARALAYVPQSQFTHWPIMARTAVAIGRNPHASSLARLSPEDDAAIDRALEATAAVDYQHRPLDQLSGGERARVLLARALAVEAPLLLLDEPVAALDPAHQIAFIARLKQLSADSALTIICVVHDLSLASRFGDAVVVINQGGLAAAGPVRDVLTDTRLSTVFGIRAQRVTDGAGEAIVPWSVDHPGNRRDTAGD
ncbi:MAG: ABC transporter ATP-binding protein [Pseudomonadota bacterium]